MDCWSAVEVTEDELHARVEEATPGGALDVAHAFEVESIDGDEDSGGEREAVATEGGGGDGEADGGGGEGEADGGGGDGAEGAGGDGDAEGREEAGGEREREEQAGFSELDWYKLAATYKNGQPLDLTNAADNSKFAIRVRTDHADTWRKSFLVRYKGSEPGRDGWSLLPIGADLEPLDDEELNQLLSAGCIGAAAESCASWMHNVVRGLGIAALNGVQIGGIEVSTVDPAQAQQFKGVLLTALGDDNISEDSCYLVSDLGTVERIENAGALLARMQGQGGQLEVLKDEGMQYSPVALAWTGGGRQKPNGIYFNRFSVTHLAEGWTACVALQSLSDAAVSVKMGDPLTSALSGDGFCAGAFKLSSERASGHGRNFVAVYSRASELHFVPWMHVEAVSYTHLTLPTNREV